MLAAPHRQVVERLLSPDRRAVRAQQEGLCRRIFLAPHEPVVEGSKQRLAYVRQRDDRLHRSVVLGSRVQEFSRARKEPCRRQVLGWLRLPFFHRPCIEWASVLSPALHSVHLPAARYEPDDRGALRDKTQHGSELVVIVSVAVDDREAEVTLPQGV